MKNKILNELTEENEILKKELLILQKHQNNLSNQLRIIKKAKAFQFWQSFNNKKKLLLKKLKILKKYFNLFKKFLIIKKSNQVMNAWYFNEYPEVTERYKKKKVWKYRDSKIKFVGRISSFLTHPIWSFIKFNEIRSNNPNPFFDSQKYLDNNIDVRNLKLNPLLHYLLYGIAEGRAFPETNFTHNYFEMERLLNIQPYSIDNFKNQSFKKINLDGTVAIHLHIFYPELINFFVKKLNNIHFQYDLYVSCANKINTNNCHKILKDKLSFASKIIVKNVPNRGRNFAPMIIEFGKDLQEYDYLLHIHSKKSPHNDSYKSWLEHIMNRLCGDTNIVNGILNLLSTDACVVYPEPYLPVSENSFLWGKNKQNSKKLLKILNSDVNIDKFSSIEFPVGGMFWARVDSIKPLLNLNFSYKDFDKEPISEDGAIAHAIERIILIIASHKKGKKSYKIFEKKYIQGNKFNNIKNFVKDRASLSNTTSLSAKKHPWSIPNYTLDSQKVADINQKISVFKQKPTYTICLLIPNNANYSFIKKAILSVQNQLYDNWQLCIFIQEKSNWNTSNILSLLVGNEHKISFIKVRSFVNQSYLLKKIKLVVRGQYFLFLDYRDALGTNALSDLIFALNSSKRNIYYNYENCIKHYIKNHQSLKNSPNLFNFSQLVIFDFISARKNKFFEAKNNESFLQIIRLMFKNSKQLSGDNLYIARNLPLRKSIYFTKKGSSISVDQYVFPLKLVIDARLINRKTTGTERYITEILKALSDLAKNNYLKIFALVNEKPKFDINYIKWTTNNYIKVISKSDVFHKTFPLSDFTHLEELNIANSVVFTPLDLISYSNPDYFLNKLDHARYKQFMESACLISDKILAISHSGAKDIYEKLNVDKNKLQSIYLGINTSLFKHKIEKKQQFINGFEIPKKYFFVISTNYPHKNLKNLYSAFCILLKKYPNIKLVRAGMDYYPFYQKDLEMAGQKIENNLINLGYVDDKYIPSLYKNAIAFVYPSLYEGFGFPVLEAMVCETPVIASNISSIPEVSGKNAILVDTKSKVKLATAMSQIIENKSLRNKLIKDGNKHVKNFSWKKTAKEYLKIYKTVVNKKINSFSENLSKYEIVNQSSLTNFSCANCKSPYVLIVSHVRFTNPKAGNELRLNKLVNYFKEQGFKVAVIVNKSIDNLVNSVEEINKAYKIVDYYEEIKANVDNNSELLNEGFEERELKDFLNIEKKFCPDNLIIKVKDLINLINPKIIITEYIWSSRVLNYVNSEILKIIDLHDMFSKKDSQVKKYKIEDPLSITEAQEKVFINRSDIALAIQENEKNALLTLKTNSQIIKVGIDFNTKRSLDYKNKKEVLIVASDNKLNRKCVNEFLSKVWPGIIDEVQDAKLRIVGKIVNYINEYLLNDSIILEDYVENLHKTYANASIVVNPVYAGTGLKVKSVEAISNCKPLVSYDEGVSGLEKSEKAPFIVVKNELEMVNKIIELLSNNKKILQLQKIAENYSNAHLSSEHIYKDLSLEISKKCWPEKKVSILCLFQRYGSKKYINSIHKLEFWYKKTCSNMNYEIWIIDSSIENNFDGVDINTGHRLLSGNNNFREFSSWQTVIQERHEEIKKFDIVHFVTSAYDRLYTDYIGQVRPQYFDLVKSQAICLGHLDYYDQPVFIKNQQSQSWIRSSFFFISVKSINLIKNKFVTVNDKSLLFNKNNKFKDDSIISKNYQNYITKWLNGLKIQGVAWHRELNNKKEFVDKTISIVNEHTLSINMRTKGIRLVDIGWLNLVNKTTFLNKNLPGEIEQIKLRNEIINKKTQNN